MSDSISLGTYLFARLNQKPLGLNSIFGVPGDFNLTLLDKISEVKDLHWRGCTNELNAAYACDGYSRVKGNGSAEGLGFGALVTTFGVGELSALNGVAGSYAEHVGMLHIVGIPSVDAQKNQLLLHHTLGNGDFSVFHKMSSHISGTTGVINDPALAPDVIDRVIREAYINQRPSYLAFPANMVDVPVPKERLNKPLDLNIPKNDPELQEEVIEEVIDKIRKAKDPVIIVDACCARHNANKEASELIKLSNFKYATTPMGKGTKDIDEQNPKFTGVYVGSLSYPHVKEAVEKSDLVLSVGALLSDFNTGSFSYSIQTKNVVEFHSDYTKVKGATYPEIRMKELLGKLIQSQALKQVFKEHPISQTVKEPYNTDARNPGTKITQQWLWSRLSKFLKPNDIVITETGTSSFGIVQTSFPNQVYGISQILWGSIGYSVGCTYGAVTAAEELDPSRRVLLFVGDGSLQLTFTEISSMVRNNRKPYLFVLNNNGYTIEKLIHGADAEYNAIQPWDLQLALPLFNAKNYENYKVSEAKELEELFTSKEFAKNDKIRFIEVMLEEMDAPENLVKQAKLSSKANSE
ncbi:putative pyruvate decarboxylase [Clavispora lusitaniae]|uniref:Pyruvate decarboxylase n=1 Tax=Clavispora lusitaniae TaxID=36911 RepID=A0AA91T1M7_CLALS|nr:putative pyruvate decarboxylase [Clavispora lusitaniae]